MIFKRRLTKSRLFWSLKKSAELIALTIDEGQLRCSYPARSTERRTGG